MVARCRPLRCARRWRYCTNISKDFNCAKSTTQQNCWCKIRRFCFFVHKHLSNLQQFCDCISFSSSANILLNWLTFGLQEALLECLHFQQLDARQSQLALAVRPHHFRLFSLRLLDDIINVFGSAGFRQRVHVSCVHCAQHF